MITVTCPNCSAENSSLSKRCISCGSELIIDGYVRCDNCRALTPEKLEFCELCGSYLSAVNHFGHEDPDDRQDDRGGSSQPSRQGKTSGDDVVPDLGDRLGLDKQRAEAREKRAKSEIPADTDIPAWLLDVDAVLKGATTPNLTAPADESREDWMREQGVALNGGTPTRDEIISSTPEEEPFEVGESLEWIDALKGDLETSAPSPSKKQTSPLPTEPKPEARKQDVAPGQIVKTAAAAAAAGDDVPRKRRTGTQPLESGRNLLGVPRQLAGTELPAWLSDQLQRPQRIDEETPEVEIELPEPARATIEAPIIQEIQEELPAPSPVLDASFEKWLKEFSEESISPDWMEEVDEQYEKAIAADIVSRGAETPGWMQDVQEEEGDAAALLGIAEITERQGTLSGLKGTIQIATVVRAVQTRPPRIDYELSKQHRKQIALLEGILNAEPEKRKAREVVRTARFPTSLRIFLALALFAIMIIPLVIPSSVGWIGDLTSLDASQPVLDFHDQIETAAGEPVLVAFDYSPAMSGEMNAIATVLLEQLAGNNSDVIITSQSAAGFQLGQSVAADTEGLNALYLGYLPGEAVGLRSMALCIEESQDCQTIFGESIAPEVQQLLGDTVLITVLASENDKLKAWIEQVEPQLPDEELLAGVTQTLGPITLPYFTSGQLDGVLVGLPDLMAYEKAFLDSEGDSARNFAINTAAIWLIAAFLFLGTVYYSVAGLRSARTK